MDTTTTTPTDDLQTGERVRFSESILERVIMLRSQCGPSIDFASIRDARGTIDGRTASGRYAIAWDDQDRLGFADRVDLQRINRCRTSQS